MFDLAGVYPLKMKAAGVLAPSGTPDDDAVFVNVKEEITHSHGPTGEHAHGGVAFTTWLDPQLAIQQAQAVKEAFSRKWPDHRDRFESGFAARQTRDVLIK